MWVSLFLFFFFLGVAYVYAIQGLFSALIACVLTILAATVAFAGHEVVAAKFLVNWQPNFALALSFMGLFLVTLILLRAAADALIRRAVLLPMLVDRIGGGVFGVITGLVTAGVLALGTQMICFGGAFMGFARFESPPAPRSRDDYDEPKERRPPDDQQEIFLKPDRLTVKLASALSSGVFSGTRDWSTDHPDYTTRLGWSGAALRGIKQLAPPGSITVLEAGPEPYRYDKKNDPNQNNHFIYEHKAPAVGKTWYKVKVEFGKGGADKDNQNRFMLRQLRLVGKDDPGDRNTVQYHPVGLNNSPPDGRREEDPPPDPEEVKLLVVANVDTMYRADPETQQTTFLFEVPTSFVPKFLEYKGLARVPITVPAKQAGSALAGGTNTPAPAPSASTPIAQGQAPVEAPREFQGRITGARGHGAGTRWGGSLPMKLIKYSARDPEMDSGKNALVQGTILAYMDEQQGSQPEDPVIESLQIPPDKRLLHFSADNIRAGSIPGQAKAFAVKVLEEYKITTDLGSELTMVGKYAIAKVGDRDVFELQYYPEYAASGARSHQAFQKIRDQHLQGDNYTCVFLYLVDPGVKVVKFSTGGSANLAQDLTSMNLVAPQ